jgi:hypothetical protein
MVTRSKKRKSTGSKKRFIGKPAGQIQERVQAENLIKCHPYYRGLSALWTQQKVDPRDRR